MDLLTANDRTGEYPQSYYASAAPITPSRGPAKGDTRADVCIIGGGYTGLSAALHLAERGYDVVLLEAHRVAFGASGRNGGLVGTGQRPDQDVLERQLGKTRARALWDIALEAVALVRGFCDEPQSGCSFHPGIIHADHRARFVHESHAYAEKLQSDYGYEMISALSRDELRSLVGSHAYFGGTLDLGAGHTDPLRYGLLLSRKAEAAGARIFETSRVTGFSHGTPCTVRTEGAQVRADYLILACNGYLGGLEPHIAGRVMPINNYTVATEPLDRAVCHSLIAKNYAVADSKFVVNFFRLSNDHRLLFGGSESYGYRFAPDIAAKVRKPMLQIFPQLNKTRIDYAWGGTLGITMNRMPDFARLAGNVLSLSGYSGHGVALASLAGKLAAEAIAGQAESFDIMASVPSRKFLGGASLRWPLLVLAMLWYSLRDRI